MIHLRLENFVTFSKQESFTMPVQKSQSSLLGKLGDKLKRAHEEHKNADTVYSEFGALPAGINGGIAQLVECKFKEIPQGKDNAGQFKFYAAGIVKSPEEHDGIQIKGLRTQLSEPMFDTPNLTRKTVSEHVAWIYNEMRKLGVDTACMEITDLEPTAAALKETAPHFRFRTWKGDKAKEGKYKDKEPMVQSNWDGLCEFNGDRDEQGATPGVQDNSGEGEANEGTPDTQTAGQDQGPPNTPDVATGTDEGGEDYAALAEIADAGQEGHEAAAKAIKDAALAAGIEESVIDNATNWTEVATALIEVTQGGGEITTEGEQTAPTPELEKPSIPTKGEVWAYKPLDPKTKKPFINPKTKKENKAIQVEVIAVNLKSKSVDLKNLSNPKVTYKGVKFEALESPE